MNEAETRAGHIDPALTAAGWWGGVGWGGVGEVALRLRDAMN